MYIRILTSNTCIVRFLDVASKFSVTTVECLYIATKYAQIILQQVLGPDINVAFCVLCNVANP